MEITITAINLKAKFRNIHHVEIMSVSFAKNEFTSLLNVWNTDEYKSLSQEIIVFDKLKIITKYKFSKNLRWNCIYNLNNGFYLLGSKFSSLYSGAILVLFKANIIIESQLFDKGYATEIHTIQKDKGDSFLISGSWYQYIPSGSHDDYVPEGWQSKITIQSSGFIDEGIDLSTSKKIKPHISDSDLNPQNYYVIEDYGVSKYNSDDILIWNQGLGHVGFESLQPISMMVPFFKTQNGETAQDGVWFSGSDHTNSERGLSESLFGRITAGGTILSFKSLLIDFPEIYKIHSIIPGIDNNCLLIVETLIIGQGNGLCLLYNHFSEGNWQQTIKYINFSKSGLKLIIQDTPEFHNSYLHIKEIFPQSERLEALKEIIIFGNASYLQNRDNGDVWSIKINNDFNTCLK